jgi:hypothetical protein
VKLSRALLAMAVSAVAVLSLCATAGAANVIVGPSLAGEWEPEECVSASCTFVNLSLGGAGADVMSPVTGEIVRFSVVGGENAGEYRLRTGTAFGPLSFTFSRWADPVTSVPSEGVQSFSASLPVETGQMIGLTMIDGASMGFREDVGTVIEWETELPESGLSFTEFGGRELAGFNAEIQPAPTIVSLGTTSGPTAGGTSVTISGTDLENATSVSFGSSPAASYVVNSESQITAVAPANASATSVSVTVTTIAGKAIASQQFGYVAPPPAPVVVTPAPKTKAKRVKQCVVPNLKGKKLPAAKVALKKADCKAGKVTKLKGATPKTGKVAAQSRKAGTKTAAGAKVNLTLKP